MDNVRESVKSVVGRIESIINDMVKEMPYQLSESIKPYVAIVMRIYANEKVFEAAKIVKPFNEELALAVIGVLKDEEGQELIAENKFGQ